MNNHTKFNPEMSGKLKTSKTVSSHRSALWLPVVLSLLCSLSAKAAINVMTNGTAFNTAANWSLASGPNATANPGSFTDLLLNSPSVALTTSSGTIHGRSWNVTNGSSYSVRANSTQAAPQVRAGTTSSTSDTNYTDEVSGISNDLIYLINNSSLTIYGTNANVLGGQLNLKLNQAGNFNIATGSMLVVFAPVDTSSTINKNGEGLVVLSGSNNYAGATKISAGIVQANGASALSTNSILNSGSSPSDSSTLNFGSADNGYAMKALSVGGSMRFTGPTLGAATVNFLGNAAQGFTGSGATKKIAVATNVNVVVNGTSFELLGATATQDRDHSLQIDGTMIFSNSVLATGSSFVAGFNKSGGGVLTLAASNSYSGSTTISGGTLRVNSPLALSSASILKSGSSVNDGSTLNLASANSGYTMNSLSVGGIMRFTGPAVGTATVTFTGGASQGFTGASATKRIFVETNVTVVVNGSAFDLFGPTATIDRSHEFQVDGALTFNSLVTDTGGANKAGFEKTGAGVLTLTASNNYNGATTVSAGRLLVNGSINGGRLTASGGTLGGTGSINVPVTISNNATLSPGASIGTLAIGSDLTIAGNVFIEVNTSASPSNDLIIVTGTLTNAGNGVVSVTNLGGAPLILGDSFKIFNQPVLNGGAMTISGGLSGGLAWSNNLETDGSVSVVAVASSSPPNFQTGGIVQLPSGSMSLTATGALGANYRLWASADVAATPVADTWTLLISGTITVSPFTIIDLSATNFPQRFYQFSSP